MPNDAYRGELEAAHARIADLEAQLAHRDADPTKVRLAALHRERDVVAALAAPHLTRTQRALGIVTSIAFTLSACVLAMIGESLMAAMCAAIAVGNWLIFAKAGRNRGAKYTRRLGDIDTKILALEAQRRTAPREGE